MYNVPDVREKKPVDHFGQNLPFFGGIDMCPIFHVYSMMSGKCEN